MSYAIEFSPDAVEHLRVLSRKDQNAALDAIEIQLTHEPHVETRNRKPMRPNPIAPWELRVGHLRVYYDMEETPHKFVLIRAIGVKDRNVIRIGNEVIIL